MCGTGMRLRCKVTAREEPSQEKNIGVSTSGTNLTYPAFEYLIKEVCLFVLICIIVTVSLHVKLNFRAHQVAYSRIYGETNQQTNKISFVQKFQYSAAAIAGCIGRYAQTG